MPPWKIETLEISTSLRALQQFNIHGSLSKYIE